MTLATPISRVSLTSSYPALSQRYQCIFAMQAKAIQDPTLFHRMLQLKAVLTAMYWSSIGAHANCMNCGKALTNQMAAGMRGAIRITQNRYLWPARHTDGANTDSYALPFGLRLRLKSSVNISSFPSQSRVILTALRHYGMFVADKGGSNWYSIALSGAPDPHWNKSDLVALTRVHASDFEVVNESSLQVSPDSGQTRAGVTATSPTPVPTPRPTKAPTVSPLASPVPTTATVLTREEVVGSDNSKVSKTSGGGWTNMPLFILAGLTFLLSP